MKKALTVILIAALCVFLSSCHELPTPEEEMRREVSEKQQPAPKEEMRQEVSEIQQPSEDTGGFFEKYVAGQPCEVEWKNGVISIDGSGRATVNGRLYRRTQVFIDRDSGLYMLFITRPESGELEEPAQLIEINLGDPPFYSGENSGRVFDTAKVRPFTMDENGVSGDVESFVTYMEQVQEHGFAVMELNGVKYFHYGDMDFVVDPQKGLDYEIEHHMQRKSGRMSCWYDDGTFNVVFNDEVIASCPTESVYDTAIRSRLPGYPDY